MQEFRSVFAFETRTKAKNKAYITSLIISVLIVFAMTFLPTILGAFEDEPSDTFGPDMITEDFGYQGDLVLFIDGKVNDELEVILDSVFDVEKVSSAEKVKEEVEAESDKTGLILESPMKGEVIKKDVGITSTYVPIAQILQANYKYNIAMPKAGIDIAKVAQIEGTMPKLKETNLGKSAVGAIGFAYIAMFFLYFLILMLGSTIATSVIREKESRMMEILITNISSKTLIVGKVFSGVFLGLIEAVCVLASMALGLFINYKFLGQDSKLLTMVLESITWDMIVVFIVVTIFGTTLYYFLFAALGALVSRIEDLQSTTAPATILVVLAFILPMTSISRPDSTLMKVTSFVPFTSPLAMVARYSMTTVPVVQILLSLAILAATTVLVAMMAIKMYRMGSLNYGNKIGFITALSQLGDKE